MMEYVRGRLTKITPETSLSMAKKYLKDASFAFFMERARNGILKSGSKDLIPHYEAVLNKRINENELNQLRENMSSLKDIVPNKGMEERTAQRFKAIFTLLKAAGISFNFNQN